MSKPGGPSLDIGVFGARGIPSTYSGYETFLTVLLPELAARGHRVTMYCRDGAIPDEGSYRGVRCVRLPALRSKQLSTPSHGLVSAVAARVARHDVVFVVNVANAVYCLLSRATGQRMVLNTDGQEWLRGKWGVVARRVFLASAGIVRWAANAVVADCAAMRAIYAEQFSADSTVIPYCWGGTAPAAEAPLLARLGLPVRGYFVAAGRLVPENQLAEITRAYLASGLPHPILVLGTANYDSPVSRQLAAMAADDGRVVLGGHVDDRAEYCGIVRDAMAYVHGHQVGGMNPSLLDAMGSGARVVAASTPFNRETLGDAGDYFDRPDDGLARVLRAVAVESPEVDEARRSAGRARVLARFSLDEVAAAHEALFAAVAARPVWSRTRLDNRWEHEEA